MSSTNRGYTRHASDYYVTPVDEVMNFLNHYKDEMTESLLNLSIIDTCAGGLNDKDLMSYPVALKLLGHTGQLLTIDIREDSHAEIKADYLQYEVPFRPDVIISNPPFNQAMEFIQKALKDVTPFGYVIFLLRLNFLESKQRKVFFEQHKPEYIFVHHKRMSFTGGGTDSVAYAHFVWRSGYNPRYSKLFVI